MMIEKTKNYFIKLLRQGEKYTQTDNLYLAKQGFYLYLTQGVTFIVSLFLSIIYARYLSKEVFGLYKYALSLLAIFSIFGLQNMLYAVIQAVARGFEGVLKTGCQAKFKWALLGSLVALGTAGYYYFWQNNFSQAMICLLIAIFLPLLESSSLYEAFLEGKKDFGQRAKYKIIAHLGFATLILLAIFFTHNALALFLAYLIANTFFNLFFLFRVYKKYQPNNSLDERTVRYGQELSLINVLNIIGGQLDKLVLFNFLGGPALAIFSFAQLPVNQADTLMQNLRKLALPKFSEKSRNEIKAGLLKKMFRLGALTFLITAVYILLAPFIFQWLFPQYGEAVIYSQILFLPFIFLPFTFIPLALQSQMMKKELYQYNIIKAIFAILAVVILVPLFGLWGAAAANLAVTLFAAIYSVWLYKKI